MLAVVPLLQAAGGADFKSLRDRAILELLFSAGLRVSELTSINRDKLDLKNKEFSVRGKGYKLATPIETVKISQRTSYYCPQCQS